MLNKEEIKELKICSNVNISYNNSDGESIVVHKDLTVIRNNEEDISFGFGKSVMHNDISEDGTWDNGGKQFFASINLN